MHAAIQEAIDQANANLSRPEQIKRWTLLEEDWLPGGDELTPTMKLKRRPINEKYAAEIAAMYYERFSGRPRNLAAAGRSTQD